MPIKIGEARDIMLLPDTNSASGEALKPVHLWCRLRVTIGARNDSSLTDQEKA